MEGNMTKRIDIQLEVEENESIEEISKVIEVALKVAGTTYLEPIFIAERKRTEFEFVK